MLVRLKKGKNTYEVMVQEGMVARYRDGSVKRIEDVVITPVVFLNIGKGTKASGEQLDAAFQTSNVNEVIELILQKGEAQESAGERKTKIDAKRHEIITAIQKNYGDRNSSQLPISRIENALSQIKPRIDIKVDALRQVEAMFSKLNDVLPMKRLSAGLEAKITVPIEMSGQASGIIRKYATVLRQKFEDVAKYEVEIHSYDQLIAELGRATKGNFELALASSDSDAKAASSSDAEASSSGKKGKGKGKKKKK